ncbi:MAG: hypothetical protein GF393_09490 [Armatimonadia bacterium]|nr:hypothetical protein [Armatimonadia bacterium]
MSRFFEFGATVLIVSVFTSLIVAAGLRREDAVTEPDVAAGSEAATPPDAGTPDRKKPRPAPEVINAPRLTDTWREEFDDGAAWALWRGEPATFEDGMLCLHDAPALPPVYYQRQPIRFAAADLEIGLRCDGCEYVPMAIAQALAGPESELIDPPHTASVRHGLELRLDFEREDGSVGWMRWKRDGHHYFVLPTQDRRLPADELTIALVKIRPEGCTVTINGERRGEYRVPRPELRWRDAAYRIYLSTGSGDTRIDYVELRPVAAEPEAQEAAL